MARVIAVWIVIVVRERREDKSLIRRVRGWRRKVECGTRIIDPDTLVFVGAEGEEDEEGPIGEIEASGSSGIRYRVSVAATESTFVSFFFSILFSRILSPSPARFFFPTAAGRASAINFRVPARAREIYLIKREK